MLYFFFYFGFFHCLFFGFSFLRLISWLGLLIILLLWAAVSLVLIPFQHLALILRIWQVSWIPLISLSSSQIIHRLMLSFKLNVNLGAYFVNKIRTGSSYFFSFSKLRIPWFTSASSLQLLCGFIRSVSWGSLFLARFVPSSYRPSKAFLPFAASWWRWQIPIFTCYLLHLILWSINEQI
jgi:hypothetical protein